jgi:hypothetical protein
MFEKSGVLFVTINLPGGSNNDNDVWYAAPTPTDIGAAFASDAIGIPARARTQDRSGDSLRPPAASIAGSGRWKRHRSEGSR